MTDWAAEAERERAAMERADDLLEEVLDLYPWRLGDGYGGALIELIFEKAAARGYETPNTLREKQREREDRRRGMSAQTRLQFIQDIAIRDGWNCRYCEIPLRIGQVTLDHVMPQSKGGPDELGNLVFACRPCNTRKGAKV